MDRVVIRIQLNYQPVLHLPPGAPSRKDYDASVVYCNQNGCRECGLDVVILPHQFLLYGVTLLVALFYIWF